MQSELVKRIIINEKKTNSEIHIVFSSDISYMPYCGVAMYSIEKNNKKLNTKFHILTDQINDEQIERFKLLNSEVNIYLIDGEKLKSLQTTDYFPTSIYYRIIAPRLLAKESRKIFYLDCDVLCDSGIEELLKIELGENIIAAAKDNGSKDIDIVREGKISKEIYFNSGIMIINIDAWLKENVESKFLEKIQERKFQYPDQDCLNLILKNRVKFLERKFNYIPKNNKNNNIKPVIIHYAGPTKPWDKFCQRTQYNELYINVYKDSPWNNVEFRNPRKSYEAKNYSKLLLQRGNLLKSFRWMIIAIKWKIIK